MTRTAWQRPQPWKDRSATAAATRRVVAQCAGTFLLLFAYAVWPGVPKAAAATAIETAVATQQACGLPCYLPTAQQLVDAENSGVGAKPPPAPENYGVDQLTASCVSQCLDNVEWYKSMLTPTTTTTDGDPSIHKYAKRPDPDGDDGGTSKKPKNGPEKFIGRIWSRIRTRLVPPSATAAAATAAAARKKEASGGGGDSLDSYSSSRSRCKICTDKCAAAVSQLYDPDIRGALAHMENSMASMRAMMDDLYAQLTAYAWDYLDCNCAALQLMYDDDDEDDGTYPEVHLPGGTPSSDHQDAIQKLRERWCRFQVCPVRAQQRSDMGKLLSAATKQVWSGMMAVDYAVGLSWAPQLSDLTNGLYNNDDGDGDGGGGEPNPPPLPPNP